MKFVFHSFIEDFWGYLAEWFERTFFRFNLVIMSVEPYCKNEDRTDEELP
jgi:hypothetical protein